MNALPAIALRVGLVVIALVLWFWTQRLISRKPPPAGGAVGDRLHAWSSPLHGWLLAHSPAANLTLIVTSALVDAFGLYLLGSAIFGATLQPLIAILIVFALRQVCQALCTLPSPPGIIWRDPGFPSLFVTYGVSNDFFFSGHTAISVLGALQLAHHAPLPFAVAGIVVAALEAITVIVLRAHYTMDVFAAVFAAWAADFAARHFAPTVDLWLRALA
ncbi:MAG TPA: phosphatase PAP2-related protein [Opitutaceae bacterium]|nr:phosphatase PAP2-related protein [Opitutaceae bacterium]